MGFQQGLSGLNSSSKSLEVIGNNVANANTYGAKSSRAEFADMYAASLGGSGVNKIGIGVHFRALHLHPWYQQNMGFQRGMLPKTEYASDRVVSLPLFTALERADQEYIIDVTRHLILTHRK